jgi:hypothetical protein
MPKKLTSTSPSGNEPSVSPTRPLSKPGRTLWDDVLKEYDITDPGGKELLHQACEALDQAASLRRIIDKDGELITTRNGSLREHPALKPELARKAFVVRTLARLGLHVEPLRSVGRPLHGGTGVTFDDPESMRAFGRDGNGGGR